MLKSRNHFINKNNKICFINQDYKAVTLLRCRAKARQRVMVACCCQPNAPRHAAMLRRWRGTKHHNKRAARRAFARRRGACCRGVAGRSRAFKRKRSGAARAYTRRQAGQNAAWRGALRCASPRGGAKAVRARCKAHARVAARAPCTWARAPRKPQCRYARRRYAPRARTRARAPCRYAAGSQKARAAAQQTGSRKRS